jgi:3-deoxy-D-manno-octulosonic-acid transferase
MKTLYTLSVYFTLFVARIAALFSGKVALWFNGRRNWEFNMREKVMPGDRIIWIHCASLGEFEQGRPVAEAIREVLPEYKILITFFSPSGYEVRKDWSGADYVFYLPADTPHNAKVLADIVNPSAVIFIKYDFWANLITELHRRDIPILLTSAIFRPQQHFFKWYGGFFRDLLKRFRHIFVQDENSARLLRSIGLNDAVVAGDTRFDRVAKLAQSAAKYGIIQKFAGSEKVVVAGSSWPPDEEIISRFIRNNVSPAKWIFAPHEIDEKNVERLERMFDVPVARYSDPSCDAENARVLIIDNIGMLSSVYSYATLAVVGGGFGKGIHNILEPACHSIPVLFGPNHNKFREAGEMISCGGGFSFSDYGSFEKHASRLLDDPEFYKTSANKAGKYVISNTGATKKIVDLLARERY